MKKSFLILICLIVNASFVFSQNLHIYRNGNLLTNNQVLTLTGGTSEIIKLPLHVKNTASATLSVKAKKIQNSLVTGSENSFCFAGTCYDPSTITSLASATIASNVFDTTFEADYNANGRSGNSNITYVFFNTANPSDSISVIVNYTTSVGINDISKSDISFSNAFPNPASSIITFTYALPKQCTSAKISIRNILGASIEEVLLNNLNGEKTINISEFKNGIYFYSLIVDEKVFYTRKLIIRH